MRRRGFVVIIVIFVVFFGLINGYAGLRGWEWLHALAPNLNGWIFWTLLWLIGYSFVIGRFTAAYLPRPLVNLLTIVGAYWFAVLQYTIPFLLFIDLIRILNQWIGILPSSFMQDTQTVTYTGAAVFILVLIILLYGVWRARNPIVVRYEVDIPKHGGTHKELHIAVVSDTHVGTINGNRRLRHMVNMVNELKPDMVLIVGDLIDDDFHPFVTQKMPDQLKSLKSNLGTYSVLGNHEYIAGHLDEYAAELEKADVRLLVDETVQIEDSFYVIGRDDISGKSHHGRPRKPLSELVKELDPEKPLILMDHQPYRLEEALKAGIDLQLSGHTHRGQMYPYHYITRKTYELDWGYLYKESMHVIVSSGFGTWGPPIRVGNNPEVVSVKVRFTGQK
jgi:predicted MPP superfamily phosphohydrolase